MCSTCNTLRFAWYQAMNISPELAEAAKAAYMAQLRSCPDHKRLMQWAQSCPANPELSLDELKEAA